MKTELTLSIVGFILLIVIVVGIESCKYNLCLDAGYTEDQCYYDLFLN